MIFEIKILCPGHKCGKCYRMIARIEEAVKMSGKEAKIEIIDTLDEMLKYTTWILPTLVINNNVVARGYIPSIQQIISYLQNN